MLALRTDFHSSFSSSVILGTGGPRAAALEQMQLVSGDDASTEKGNTLEETKLQALLRYASAHFCRDLGDLGDGKQSDVGDASAGGRGRVGGGRSSGDAEMDHIVQLLAAAGMALPC